MPPPGILHTIMTTNDTTPNPTISSTVVIEPSHLTDLANDKPQATSHTTNTHYRQTNTTILAP